jgi:ATP10 protein
MKLCLIVALTVILGNADPSPILLKSGEPLPPIRGEFLSGKNASLPEVAAGKVALLALGFSYDSRFPVEDWVKKFREAFGKNPSVTFYEIPMIGGIARLGKWFIDSGMRKGTPPQLHENVITVYGNTDVWKKRVNFNEPNHAYLILLDMKGNVRWVYHGNYCEKDFLQLSSKVKELLNENSH